MKKKTEHVNNTSEQSEESEKQVEMNLTDEMTEEPYQPVILSDPVIKKTPVKVEKTVVEKALKAPKVPKTPKAKSAAPKSAAPKSAIPKDDDPEIENWLIIRDGVKYWTTDEFEKNGEVYEYCIDSEGDGCAGNVAIGHLKDGELLLIANK